MQLGLACLLFLAATVPARANLLDGVNWPAIGSDIYPALIITINANSTVTVNTAAQLGGTAQGAYDGSDDSYIGVINRSSVAVGSLIVSGPANTYAFDADGIGSSPYNAGTNSQDTSDGKYGGPDAFFTGINSNLSSGTVHFIGGIAPNGGSAYFSLEGTPSASELTGGGVTAVPEPGTLTLASIGVLGLFGYHLRRKQQAA